MMMISAIRRPLLALALAAGVLIGPTPAQDGPPPGGPGPGFGPPGSGEDRKLLKAHDKDKNGWLDKEERKVAREALKSEREARPESRGDGPGGPPRMGGPFGDREARDPPKRGMTIKPSDVTPVPETVSLYEPSALRTIFFEFENADWEAELADFSRTDVEVPATLTVDGKKYPGAGVSFRGASSLFGVGTGYKRSLNVSIDARDEKQRLLGYKTLNLLNVHADPTFLHSFLVSFISRQYLPAPKVNHVRVVVNGENWGIYANAQQFDAIMVRESFPKPDGVRWKVPGSPRARGGLEFFGSDLAEYKKRFELKTKDGAKPWKDLVNLCQVLNEAPIAELEARLAPILDLDGALRFLAVEVVVANDDGYWTRASDYAMFQDPSGRFHLIPHDMNEAFGGGGMGPPGRRGGGRGGPPGDGPPPPPDRQGGNESRGARGPGGPGGMVRGNPTLDPLIGLDDPRKPLRSRLLSVPSLRKRYLQHVRDVASKWLDWKNLGPVVARQRALIEREIDIDTHKLTSIDAFRRMTADEAPAAPAGNQGGPPPGLRSFAEQRRRYLLDHAEIKALGDGGEEGR
jgi:hypothetical protein